MNAEIARRRALNLSARRGSISHALLRGGLALLALGAALMVAGLGRFGG